MPSNASLLAIDPPNLKLTAVKAAEDEHGLIVRLVNPSTNRTRMALRTHLPIHRAALVRLDETPERDLLVNDRQTVEIDAGPHQIVTLRLEFDTT